MGVGRRNSVLGKRLIVQSMSWTSDRNDSVVRQALQHLTIGLEWSVRSPSRSNDYSWLLVPLLLAIRVSVYFACYILSMIRMRID